MIKIIENVKVCPFCGEGALRVKSQPVYNGKERLGNWCYIWCCTCGTRGPRVGNWTIEQSIITWNLRGV